MEPESYITAYQQYLQDRYLPLSDELLAKVAERIQHTQWDEPQSPLDLNNVAVMALIEAEASQDVAMREMYLDMARTALQEGAAHPLCAAHLTILQSLTGYRQDASETAYETFIAMQLPAWADATLPAGLIFLPKQWLGYLRLPYTQLATLLELEDSYKQSILLASETLYQAQMAFYSPQGLRFLQLATQLFPTSALVNLTLGLSSIMKRQWEGLLYLHRAYQHEPQNAAIMQALFLTYKDLGQLEVANFWQQKASPMVTEQFSTNWSCLPTDSQFTYVSFEDSLLMAVEASFQSFVTGVLVAKGTWFEDEMEFWQNHLQPGMVVLDVGANVGVYTFSAAQQVGETGRVLAIEPFSKCVQCLQETCRVNHLKQVTVCRGAASDRNGTAYLSLNSSSEINQLVTKSDDSNKNVEEVPCFTLDTLVEQEQLQQVDVLKIDAEGHELQVLLGSDRLLSQFKPVILYENMNDSQLSNLAVAEYLVNRGYQLFIYQPFIKQLKPIQLTDNFKAILNIIAMPTNRT